MPMEITPMGHDHCDNFGLRFQNVFRPKENAKLAFTNSAGLGRVFEMLRFHDGLVYSLNAYFC